MHNNSSINDNERAGFYGSVFMDLVLFILNYRIRKWVGGGKKCYSTLESAPEHQLEVRECFS